MTGGTKKTFDDVLEKIRSESKSMVELGERFEKLTLDFLSNDKQYKNRFEKIWTWREWAKENKIKEKHGTGHDLGIDLVAKEYGGTMCAIQCKCYDDDTFLEMNHASSFISEGKIHKMDHYILACTGQINSNALTKLHGVRCNIIDKEHFKNSSIDWSQYPKVHVRNPFKLRDYQQHAFDDVVQKFKTQKVGKNSSKRGKMIMACGTGKTLVSLHIAEKMAGTGSTILYLVPSISLILQSMREWAENSNMKHYYMAVCSDSSIRNEEGTLTELEMPASTNIGELKEKLKRRSNNTMNVIFSTYNSIEVVMSAMRGESLDVIFCDEAHRTAGIEDKKRESYLALVHYDKNIKSKYRLYMTATPRIFTPDIKGKAEQKEKKIISMDDDSIYGPVLHDLSFYDAVHKYKALSDFKVRVTVMDEDTLDRMIQDSMPGDDNILPLNEKALMTSVWDALQYPDGKDQKNMLQRVLVFCDMINSSKLFAGEKIKYKVDITEDSERLERTKIIDSQRSFAKLVDHIKAVMDDSSPQNVKVKHVDGGDNAQTRRRELNWLKKSHEDTNTCRMLSNARCLSEGVDVPALDGVVFMNPRKSVVDIVQAVGRVMRKSEGKKYGYVILPVGIPAGVDVDQALSDSENFKVVWQVLNALRSHDPKLADEINHLILEPPDGKSNEVTNRIIIRHAIGHNLNNPDMPTDRMIKAISTKLVQKVGDIDYYDEYGAELGRAASTIEARMKNLTKSNKELGSEIKTFHKSLQGIINDTVTEDETIQIISQHIILSKIFNLLFSGEFTSHNPIAKVLEKTSQKFGLKEELEGLSEFYDKVEREISGIKAREARQNFIKKIYSNFFSSTKKKETEKHGVVYTPVEVIDFIINSVNHVLKTEFKMTFNDKDVKILDPFTGTGTFIARLLESKYIDTNLYEKYKTDLFVNEFILLAYYIATVNIETTYSSLKNGGKYVPFKGTNYTDTFRINPRYKEDKRHREEQSILSGPFKEAHERTRLQRASHLHVIMSNPPYSAGQSNYNDQNQNTPYSELDKRIKDTYMPKSLAHNKVSMYDSYIRSLRWATDRIGNSGIIAFVTNASFIHSDTASGIRASLHEEFTDVWCFDLRGNQRTQGETSRKEGGKIFGSGSRAPVAITILVKNPKKKTHSIHYKDIGDYLDRKQKIEKINEFESIDGIDDWQAITPDRHHDWVGQRNEEFYNYTAIGNKETKSGNGHAVFRMYSRGIATGRDAWVYNSSFDDVEKNMRKHIDYCGNQDLNNIKFDPKKAKWTAELIGKLKKVKRKLQFNKKQIRTVIYRPFFKQFLYFDNAYNSALYRIPQFFPKGDSENLAICIPDKGKTGMFSTMMTDITPDLHLIEQSQCFPFRVYSDAAGLDGGGGGRYIENLAIIVPYKFTGQFSTFITDTTPDLEVVHHGQCFPFCYYTEGRLRREHTRLCA